MFSVLLAIVASALGTLFSDIVLSDELYRTINTFLNLLIIVLLPIISARTAAKTKKELEPKVDKIVENTEHIEPKVDKVVNHLTEWDGETERRGEP